MISVRSLQTFHLVESSIRYISVGNFSRDYISLAISIIFHLWENFLLIWKIVRQCRRYSSLQPVLKMDSPSDIFQSRLYRLNRVLLSLLGQWPFQQDRHRRVIFVTMSFLGITQAITQVIILFCCDSSL